MIVDSAFGVFSRFSNAIHGEVAVTMLMDHGLGRVQNEFFS